MPTEKEGIKSIYGDLGLESQGVSFEEFDSTFSANPELRKSVYADLGLEANGVTFDDYEDRLGFSKKKVPTEPVSKNSFPDSFAGGQQPSIDVERIKQVAKESKDPLQPLRVEKAIQKQQQKTAAQAHMVHQSRKKKVYDDYTKGQIIDIPVPEDSKIKEQVIYPDDPVASNEVKAAVDMYGSYLKQYDPERFAQVAKKLSGDVLSGKGLDTEAALTYTQEAVSFKDEVERMKFNDIRPQAQQTLEQIRQVREQLQGDPENVELQQAYYQLTESPVMKEYGNLATKLNAQRKNTDEVTSRFPNTYQKMVESEDMQKAADAYWEYMPVGYSLVSNIGRGVTDGVANTVASTLRTMNSAGQIPLFDNTADWITDAAERTNQYIFPLPSSSETALFDKYVPLNIGGNDFRVYVKDGKVTDIRYKNGYRVYDPTQAQQVGESYMAMEEKPAAITDMQEDMLLPKLARTGTDMAMLLGQAALLKGMGMSQFAALTTSGYLFEYENAYNEIKAKDPFIDDEAAKLFASGRSLLVGALENINPQSYLFSPRVAKSMTQKYTDALLSGVTPKQGLFQAIKGYAEEGWAESLQEYSQDMASLVTNKLTNSILGRGTLDADYSWQQGAETGLLTFITAGLMKATDGNSPTSQLHRDALFSAVQDYDKVVGMLEQQVGEKKISEQDMNRVLATLDQLKPLVEGLPKDMNDKAKSDLTGLFATRLTLQNKIAQAGTTQEQAQLTEQIAGIEKVIEEITGEAMPSYVIDGQQVPKEVMQEKLKESDFLRGLIEGDVEMEVKNDPQLQSYIETILPKTKTDGATTEDTPTGEDKGEPTGEGEPAAVSEVVDQSAGNETTIPEPTLDGAPDADAVGDGAGAVEVPVVEVKAEEIIATPEAPALKDVDFTEGGGNKLVDESGEPLTVYHGTDVDGFDNFNLSQDGGIHFTKNESTGNEFGSRIIKAKVSIKNPADYEKLKQLDSDGYSTMADKIAQLKKEGYDGIINDFTTKKHVVAFSPKQIKIEQSLSTKSNKATPEATQEGIKTESNGKERRKKGRQENVLTPKKEVVAEAAPLPKKSLGDMSYRVRKKKILEGDPSNLREVIMHRIAAGLRFNTEDIRRELGFGAVIGMGEGKKVGQAELNKRVWMHSNKAPRLGSIIESIIEEGEVNLGKTFEEDDVRNEIIDVIGGYDRMIDVVDDLHKAYGDKEGNIIKDAYERMQRKYEENNALMQGLAEEDMPDALHDLEDIDDMDNDHPDIIAAEQAADEWWDTLPDNEKEQLTKYISNENDQTSEPKGESETVPESEGTGKVSPKAGEKVTPEDKIADLKAKIAAKKAARKNIGVFSNPGEENAEMLKLYTDLAIEYIKKGIKDIKAFLSEVDAEDHELATKAWEDAQKEKRRFTQQFLNDPNIPQYVKDAVTNDAIYYDKLPNKISLEAANKIVDAVGLEQATQDFLTSKHNMSAPIRLTLGQVILRRTAAELGDSKAVDIINAVELEVTKAGTEYGQAIQVLSLFKNLSPAGQLIYAQREIRKQREKKLKNADKDITKKKKAVKDANEKAVDELLGEKSPVSQAAEKTATVNPVAVPVVKKRVGKKIISDERYREAKAKLKGKFFSGFDPEVVVIAAYHIQEGAIKFSDFSKKMVREFGSGVKKHLQEMYAAAKEELKDAGIPESEFSSEKEVADHVLQLQAEELAKLIVQRVKTAKAKDDPIKNMIGTLLKKANEKYEAEKKPKKSDISLIAEAITNRDEYAALWDASKKEVESLIDNSNQEEDVKEAQKEKLDAYFKEVIGQPFSDKQLQRAVKEGLRSLDIDIKDVIRRHYTVYDAASRSLTEKLVSDAGLSLEDAAYLSEKVQREFNRIATIEKRKALDRIKKPVDKVKAAKNKNVEDEIIALSNLGAFSDAEFLEAYADQMGFPKLTEENIREIQKLAERVEQEQDGFRRMRAIEDLLTYQGNIKGVSLAETAMAIWYANILSGPTTHLINLAANTANITAELIVGMATNPRSTRAMAKGLWIGLQRGILEAKETLRTGYSPISGKADILPTLERKRFFGGGMNPANYLKYVRRAMVASDVMMFEGAKEMRAYQLAAKEAHKAGKLDPDINEWQYALDRVGASKDQIEAATEQAQDEYDAMVININSNDKYSEAEKKKLIAQEKRDVPRRIFELRERVRDESDVSDAEDFGRRTTFNYPPEGILGVVAGQINQLTSKVPALKLIVPFTNIIANVSNEQLNYTPIGAIRAARGGSMFMGEGGRKNPMTKEDKTRMITKSVLGTVSAAILYALASGDDDEEPLIEITANGYNDFKKNYELQATGWQPYSVKIGDKWYNYQYSPFMLMFSVIGQMKDAEKYRGAKINDNFFTKMQVALTWATRSFFDNTYLSSVDTFLKGIFDNMDENGVDNMMKGVTSTATGFVMPNFYTQGAKEIEKAFEIPTKEMGSEYYGRILQHIPYARNSYNDKIDGLGDPIIPDTDKFISVVKNDDKEADKIWNLLAEKMATTNPPSYNKLNSKGVYDPKLQKVRPLTLDEYYEFSKERGRFLKEVLLQNYDAIKEMDNTQFKKVFTRWKAIATLSAKAKIMQVELKEAEDLQTEEEVIQSIGKTKK